MDPSTSEQPTQPVAPQPSSPAPVAPSGEDPGKTLGIVGLILAFFVPLVGLILSIIANSKSKAAGFKNSVAFIGIILNAVFIVLSIVIGVILLIGSAALIQNEVKEQQENASSKQEDGTQPGLAYPQASRDIFMSSCADSSDKEAACACLLANLEETMSFEEFSAYDKLLSEGKENAVPDSTLQKVDDAVSKCQ